MDNIELQALVALANSDISLMHAENAVRAFEGKALAYGNENWQVTGAAEIRAELVRRGILPAEDAIPVCEECFGYGFHFIPNINGVAHHAIERCDSCCKYDSDKDAAAHSGCLILLELAHDDEPERYFPQVVPEDSPMAKQNMAMLRAGM